MAQFLTSKHESKWVRQCEATILSDMMWLYQLQQLYLSAPTSVWRFIDLAEPSGVEKCSSMHHTRHKEIKHFEKCRRKCWVWNIFKLFSHSGNVIMLLSVVNWFFVQSAVLHTEHSTLSILLIYDQYIAAKAWNCFTDCDFAIWEFMLQ